MDLSAACAAAEVAFQRGDIVDARRDASEVLAATRERGDRLCEARALQVLAEIDYDELAHTRAVERLDQVIAIRKELLGDDDFATRYSRACRAVVLVSENRPADSDADLALATAAGAVPASPADAAAHARFWVALGSALSAREREEEARPIFEALFDAEKKGEKIEPLAMANACLQFGGSLEGTGETHRALALNRRSVELRRVALGNSSLRVALALVGLGTSQLRLGRLDEARATLLESMAMLKESGHEAHPRSSLVCLGLSVVEILSGKGPASERWIGRAIELETRTFGGSHHSTATMVLSAAKIFGMRGYHGRAVELAQRAAAALLPRVQFRAQLFEDAVSQGFDSLRHLKRYDDIARWLEPMLEQLDAMQPKPVRSIAPLLNMIGEAYAAAGRLTKAEAVLRRSLRLAEDEHGSDSEAMRILYINLANLLNQQKRTVEAHDAEKRAKQIAETLAARSSLRLRRRGLA